MFRFRQIKPEYLHLYEPIKAEERVTQRMIDKAEVIFNFNEEKDEDDDEEKVLKVFNHENSSTREGEQDADVKEDVATNASPFDPSAHQKYANDLV